MQTYSQGIAILPERQAKIHSSCEEMTITIFEMEIVLLLVLIVEDMETTIR